MNVNGWRGSSLAETKAVWSATKRAVLLYAGPSRSDGEIIHVLRVIQESLASQMLCEIINIMTMTLVIIRRLDARRTLDRCWSLNRLRSKRVLRIRLVK